MTATRFAGFSTVTLELTVQHVHIAHTHTHAADNSAKSFTPVDSCGCQLRFKLNAPPASDAPATLPAPPAPAAHSKNARGDGSFIFATPAAAMRLSIITHAGHPCSSLKEREKPAKMPRSQQGVLPALCSGLGEPKFVTQEKNRQWPGIYLKHEFSRISILIHYKAQ